SASRSRPASAGACPEVEIATVTPPRRTTPPAYALADWGSSTALTKIRRSSAAAATSLFTSGVAAAMTNQAPSRSEGTKGRRSSATGARSTAAEISGAITLTRAPAANSAGNLAPATLPAPTSTTFRPASFRNIGRSSEGPAATGLEGFVGVVELGFVILHRGEN